MLAYPQNRESSISIIGDKGAVRIGGIAVNETQIWQFKHPDSDDKIVDSTSYENESVYGIGHPFCSENLIRTLRGEVETATDSREGLFSQRPTKADYLSARNGRRMAFPLEY